MVWVKLTNSDGLEKEYFISAERHKTWFVTALFVVDTSGSQNDVTINWSSIPAKLIKLEGQTSEGDVEENTVTLAVALDSEKGRPMRAERMQHISHSGTGSYELYLDVIEGDLKAHEKRLLEMAILNDVLTGEYPFQRIVETDDN